MIFRSLRAAVPHLLVLSLSLSLLALPAFADSDSDEDEKKKTMTGVWVTRPAAPFVYQDPDGFELGVAAPVKEITLMRWELEEDENGLITGSPSRVCRPVPSSVAGPELIMCRTPPAAWPSSSWPVTRFTASGLQYVRTSAKICAVPVSKLPISMLAPLRLSFSVATR